MLTPQFDLDQDEVFLTISIRAPFAKITETDVFVDGCEFKFYSKPYYLRLSLPGAVLEDGREAAEYEAGSGTFTIKLPKETRGLHFDGLDMLTTLLAPMGAKSALSPGIEVISNPGALGAPSEGDSQEEEEEFEWFIEQNPYKEGEVSLNAPTYGFGNQRSGVLHRLQEELHDIVDLKDADSIPVCKRQELQHADEQKHFSDDHYLADQYHDSHIKPLLAYHPPWDTQYKQVIAGAKSQDIVQFTEEEKEEMRKLPRKEYLLDAQTECAVFLGLVDLLFAFAYDHRTTEGDGTVESGWTIAKLSAMLSWFQVYSSLKEVLTTTYRRCLIFPLHRHWKLAVRAHRDVHRLLALGKKSVLKSLLSIRSVLRQGDSRYILSDLYMDDYCVWIQSVSHKKLQSLAENVAMIKVGKQDVHLDLPELEAAASLAIEDQQRANAMTAQVAALSMQGEDRRSDGAAKTGHVSPAELSDSAVSVTEERERTESLDLCSSTESETSESSSDEDDVSGADSDDSTDSTSESDSESDVEEEATPTPSPQRPVSNRANTNTHVPDTSPCNGNYDTSHLPLSETPESGSLRTCVQMLNSQTLEDKANDTLTDISPDTSLCDAPCEETNEIDNSSLNF